MQRYFLNMTIFILNVNTERCLYIKITEILFQKNTRKLNINNTEQRKVINISM